MEEEKFIHPVDQENRSFFLNSYKNLIKTDNGFELQPVVEEDENGKFRFLGEYDLMDYCNHDCWYCKYFIDRGKFKECEFCTKLLKFDTPKFFVASCINHCDVYTPIQAMNIIKTESDMIDFIEKVKNVFCCPEDYEDYFGLERNWDEETGDILETTREYYKRGGKFTKIPDKYPCVICFSLIDFCRRSLSSLNNQLQWIYIGE